LAVLVKMPCTTALVEVTDIVGDQAVKEEMWQASVCFPLYLVGHCSHRDRTVLIPLFPALLYVIWHSIIIDMLQHTEQVCTMSCASGVYSEMSGSSLGRDISCPDRFLWFPSVPPGKCQNSTLVRPWSCPFRTSSSWFTHFAVDAAE
jgi:hypothetical protein